MSINRPVRMAACVLFIAAVVTGSLHAQSREAVTALEAGVAAMKAGKDDDAEAAFERALTRMPSWTVGAYDGRIRVPIKGALADIDDLDRVLAHEFVHAVVAMLGGRNVPVWVNEGLAVTLEASDKDHVDAAFGRVRTRPPLQALHGSFARLSDADAGAAYAVSAHAVKRMMDLRGPYAAVALMQDLARGAEFASAFQQHFAMRYEEFQAMVARD